MRRVMALLVVLVAANACGGTRQSTPITSGHKATAQDSPSAEQPRPVNGAEPVNDTPVGDGGGLTCRAGSYRRLRNPRTAYAAVVRRHTTVVRRPRGASIAAFGTRNINGVPMVFGVLGALLDHDCHPVWYRVQVPIRPNGTIGFVHASDVELDQVHTRVVVDLSARRLSLFRDGQRVFASDVGIGAPATPTPIGSFYVNQKLIPADASGPWGPGALGISAFSPRLVHWVQGGPIAIHGTNDPSSVGRRMSHGCLRLHNNVLVRLFRAAPTGTPVLVHA